jgi:hypothetical protein
MSEGKIETVGDGATGLVFSNPERLNNDAGVAKMEKIFFEFVRD